MSSIRLVWLHEEIAGINSAEGREFPALAAKIGLLRHRQQSTTQWSGYDRKNPCHNTVVGANNYSPFLHRLFGGRIIIRPYLHRLFGGRIIFRLYIGTLITRHREPQITPHPEPQLTRHPEPTL